MASFIFRRKSCRKLVFISCIIACVIFIAFRVFHYQTGLSWFLKDCHVSISKSVHGVQWQISDEKEYYHSAKLFNGSSYWSDINSSSCSISQVPHVKTDIEMTDFFKDSQHLYPTYSYNKNQWDSENELKIIVVPHSHNDPGWRMTFEDYYYHQTQYIMNGLIKRLGHDKRRKFILSEICTLAHWWDQVDDNERKILKSYLESEQLEIVSGGWVMTDEASAHYYSMIDQFVEGHQWLHDHLGYTPHRGWAVDPFGHSSTMAYLNNRMGLNNVVLNRVHHRIKDTFGAKKQLDFIWRQMWDRKNSTDVHCHVLPYHYDTYSTCGPNGYICCQFDFTRLPGSMRGCGSSPRYQPRQITDENVQERAETLLDQYRKSSQMFQSNVLLVPLGGDFHYIKIADWENQFNNYQKLFDYLNSRHDLHVHAQFGTVKDYFEAVEARGNFTKSLPTLSGDFFPYSDQGSDYWSGYFTSRPLLKYRIRVLEHYQRASEILFSLVLSHFSSKQMKLVPAVQDMAAKLVSGRRNLGFFQHHDTITGTSRRNVIVSCLKKILASIQDLQTVICQCAAYLLDSHSHAVKFDLDEYIASYNSLSTKLIIDLCEDKMKTVVFYNSLPQQRQELITLIVSSPRVCVRDFNGDLVATQLIPVWKDDHSISESSYEIAFLVDVPALGLASYLIVNADYANNGKSCATASSVTVHNTEDVPNNSVFTVSKRAAKPFVLGNSQVAAHFTEDGLLNGVRTHNTGLNIETKLGFFIYNMETGEHKSGPYLFVPNSSATPISIDKPYFRTIIGPLLSQVEIFLPHVIQKIILKNSSGVDGFGIDMVSVVDFAEDVDKEIMMRFETDIENGDEFFTDQNGFQIAKRRSQKNTPIQGNFYPITTIAFIEDDAKRFTLIPGHSVGCSSLKPGWLEVVLDRRFTEGDGRGLGEGILDTEKSIHHFRLLFEKRTCRENCRSKASNLGFPSLVTNMAVNSLLHPTMLLIARGSSWLPSPRVYETLSQDFPCDIHLLNLRARISETSDGSFKVENKTSIIMHRVGMDCHLDTPLNGCRLTDGKITLGDHFSKHFQDDVARTSLSLLTDEHASSKKSELHISAMEIAAYNLFH